MKLQQAFFLAGALCLGAAASAQTYQPQELAGVSARHERRIASRRLVENHSFSSAGEEYIQFKNALADRWDVQYGLDISFTAQRVSPSGKQTAVQGLYYPYITWGVFKDGAFGSGTVNFNYNLVRYWGASGNTLNGRARTAAGINDYLANEEIFSQLTYTHTLPGKMNWLSFTAGQFPVYNFDGTAFTDNQQTALVNFALSQNASSSYASAGIGAYAQASAGAWTLAAGYQDGQNISGQNLDVHTAFGGKYTAFASASWTPDWAGWGPSQYAVLVYHQPSVSEQPGASNGWSVNASQGVGGKWTLFGRANGSTGGVTGIKNSYVLGVSCADPLDRNPLDAVTLGVAYNRLSGKGLGYPGYYRNSETALEVQWAVGIGKFVTLTPDLQVYPRAGLSPNNGIVTVAGLRTTVML